MTGSKLHPALQMLTGGRTMRTDFAGSNEDEVWTLLEKAFHKQGVVIVAGSKILSQIPADMVSTNNAISVYNGLQIWCSGNQRVLAVVYPLTLFLC